MKKLYFLDEEEKNRILNIHEGATKRQYLNEAESTDLYIAKLFYDEGAEGGGTDPDSMVRAIKSITTKEQFWSVNTIVKNRPDNDDKLDIAGVINDEFEYGLQEAQDNKSDLDEIRNWLKTKLGIDSTIQGNGGGSYVDGTFKITSKPVATTTNTEIPKWADCIKKFGGTMEVDKDPKWVKVPLEDGKFMWFQNNNYAVFRGTQDIKGSWACDGGKLTIELDDKWTWDGKWIDPNKKTVVDPKVAYQQRAKQVTQQTQTTTKQIQTLLGQEPTGNLDAIYVDKVIDLLKQ
jgi:hypothetical protein